ncbi:CDP-diacylglycerol--glycerol-3-phosphate 3-phosphatidyltransferase [symbiont of Argiope bruennichi]|uniref:CDP-diacylglycerol--glycerol-3-phosphate 3-phosphatidyltransferase n=1 Tax=symbiont of Argiope bruennichi TaxID=2810479 RepID=UPI003DA34560
MNHKKINFANLISLSRLFLCLSGIILLFFTFHNSQSQKLNFYSPSGIRLFIAVIIFLLCGFTDFLDGYIARKYKCVSDIGKLLDPLIDKILINFYLITIVVFTKIGKNYFFILITFLLRDYVVDFLRLIFSKEKIIIKASIYGKLKTVIQIIFITLLLISFYFENNIFSQITFYSGIIGVSFSIFSMLDYFSKNNIIKKLLFFEKKND